MTNTKKLKYTSLEIECLLTNIKNAMTSEEVVFWGDNSKVLIFTRWSLAFEKYFSQFITTENCGGPLPGETHGILMTYLDPELPYSRVVRTLKAHNKHIGVKRKCTLSELLIAMHPEPHPYKLDLKSE